MRRVAIAIGGGFLALAQAACAGAGLRTDVTQLRVQVEQLGAQQDRLRVAVRRAFPGGGAALFREGYALHHRGEYAAAERVLRDYLRLEPPSEMAGEARIWLGEALFARGLHRQALGEWQGAAALVPGDERRARLLYRMAAAHRALGEADAARRVLLHILRHHPQSDTASQARADLGAP
jgi:TolA-binding protein